jgi:hypothetical protein
VGAVAIYGFVLLYYIAIAGIFGEELRIALFWGDGRSEAEFLLIMSLLAQRAAGWVASIALHEHLTTPCCLHPLWWYCHW